MTTAPAPSVHRCQRPHGEGDHVRTWQARCRFVNVRDYRGIDFVVCKQMLLALHATTAGEWMSTNPEAERYSTMVWVDTVLHVA